MQLMLDHYFEPFSTVLPSYVLENNPHISYGHCYVNFFLFQDIDYRFLAQVYGFKHRTLIRWIKEVSASFFSRSSFLYRQRRLNQQAHKRSNYTLTFLWHRSTFDLTCYFCLSEAGLVPFFDVNGISECWSRIYTSLNLRSKIIPVSERQLKKLIVLYFNFSVH